MIKILRLSATTEHALLKDRESEDCEAFAVANRIVSDIRRRGDAAVESWTKKFDKIDLERTGLWITRGELKAAGRNVSPEFRRAIKHAAENIRRVAERQKPHEWKLRVERGITVEQAVRPLQSDRVLHPWRSLRIVFHAIDDRDTSASRRSSRDYRRVPAGQ